MNPKEWIKKKYMDVYLKQLKLSTQAIFEDMDEDTVTYMAFYIKEKYPELDTLQNKLDKFITEHCKDKLISFNVDFFGKKKSIEVKLRW